MTTFTRLNCEAELREKAAGLTAVQIAEQNNVREHALLSTCRDAILAWARYGDHDSAAEYLRTRRVCVEAGLVADVLRLEESTLAGASGLRNHLTSCRPNANGWGRNKAQ